MPTPMRIVTAALLGILAPLAAARTQPAQSAAACAEMVAVTTPGGAIMSYALSRPSPPSSSAPVVLALLPGGDGNVGLDARGCPRALRGNFLVRAAPLFRSLGFATALVDTPSTHKGEDGLGAHRGTPEHARELGLVVADLRERLRAAVWVVAVSRGTISAVNLAAGASGRGVPDGLVLASIVTAGQAGGRRPWVAQSVFDHRLESIAVPVLLLGHALDSCPRSPPSQMDRVALRLAAPRSQLALVTGGPGGRGQSGLEACEGRSPHGFVGQESEVVEGIARFLRGGRY